VLGEGPLLLPRANVDGDEAARKSHGRLDRLGDAPSRLVLRDDPVHDDVDVVFRLFGNRNLIRELAHFTIDAYPNEALFGKLPQLLAMFALSSPNHGSEDLQPGFVPQGDHAIRHLLDGLAGNWFSASIAVGLPDSRVEESKVVVDLGCRPDRGSRILAGSSLFDRDCGRQAVDGIDVGLCHLFEKLTRVGG